MGRFYIQWNGDYACTKTIAWNISINLNFRSLQNAAFFAAIEEI